MTDQLPDWIKPGVSFVISHNREPTRFHVRAIVDDNQVVMRYWRAAKRRWQYVVEDDIWFKYIDAHGRATAKPTPTDEPAITFTTPPRMVYNLPLRDPNAAPITKNDYDWTPSED